MASLYVVDTPEYEPVWQAAAGDRGPEVHRDGAYVELRFTGTLTIDRLATGVRHAVWYSSVAAVSGGRVVQFDKHALRVEASAALADG